MRNAKHNPPTIAKIILFRTTSLLITSQTDANKPKKNGNATKGI